MIADSPLAQFISHYGYAALAAGTVLEGETVVIIAGFMARQGYLELPWIIVWAIVGSAVSDQGLFFLARFKGAHLLQRFPKVADKVRILSEKLQKRPGALAAYALLFRFLYGLRNISPLVLGLGSIPALEFVILNLVGAVLWASTFSLLGYVFAATLETVLGKLARYEMAIVVLLLLAGAGLALYRRRKTARQSEAQRADRP